MNIKQIFVLFLVACLLLTSFTGCDTASGSETADTSSSPIPETSAPSESSGRNEESGTDSVPPADESGKESDADSVPPADESHGESGEDSISSADESSEESEPPAEEPLESDSSVSSEPEESTESEPAESETTAESDATESDSDEAASTDKEPSETTPPTKLIITKNASTQYQIVVNEDDASALSSATENLVNGIIAYTGVQLPLITDADDALTTDYEILIGTVRDGKYFDTSALPSLTELDFHITVIGTRILILGGSTYATSLGIEYFIETYLPKEITDPWRIPIETEYTKIVDRSGMLTVMSQNLLNNNSEHSGKTHYLTGVSVDQSGKNSIKNRQPRIRSLFLEIMPDAVGLQECSNWHSFLENDSALLDAGYKLMRAKKDPKLSILYNTNTLEALESGSIWLTEDPENLSCSVEWNSNGNPRLAHFVRFRIKATGETFVLVNCHIGFENTTLQYNQTRVVAEYCAQLAETYGDAVVCVGDFNSAKGSDHYKGFTRSFANGFMEDSKYAALVSATGTGSFCALGAMKTASHAIDQIMVSEDDWLVSTYRVDYTVFGDGDLYYSDHFGIVAELMLTPEDS